MKQEKEIDDGVVYRGELSTFSNFSPAPFTLDDQVYAHVEQHYQYNKAIHHDGVETATAILSLSNPLRIKSLGDGIQANSAWLERRMLVLYDGVRAKFKQNLALQNELLSTDGKHLYEATTDPYFGCGIGYDSKPWQQKDWSGENVAGLVLKKVRDELLGINPEEVASSNTLTEIASQEDVSSIEEMETNSCYDDNDSEVTDTPSQSSPKHTSDYSSANHHNKAACDGSLEQYRTSTQGHSKQGHTRGRGRGKGRGRGRSTRGNPQRNYHASNNHRNSMSVADRNFLGLKEMLSKKSNNNQRTKDNNTKSSSSGSNQMIWATLKESQKKGLAELGLTPDLFSTGGSVSANAQNKNG